MYEYKMVQLGFKKLGLKAIVSSELEEHHEIIDKHAKEELVEELDVNRMLWIVKNFFKFEKKVN